MTTKIAVDAKSLREAAQAVRDDQHARAELLFQHPDLGIDNVSASGGPEAEALAKRLEGTARTLEDAERARTEAAENA